VIISNYHLPPDVKALDEVKQESYEMVPGRQVVLENHAATRGNSAAEGARIF
jgi:hypothetical protein